MANAMHYWKFTNRVDGKITQVGIFGDVFGADDDDDDDITEYTKRGHKNTRLVSVLP